ncbi:MAG: hypothetical protein U0Q15_04640 [Kineosporiaceae bacterium]
MFVQAEKFLLAHRADKTAISVYEGKGERRGWR